MPDKYRTLVLSHKHRHALGGPDDVWDLINLPISYALPVGDWVDPAGVQAGYTTGAVVAASHIRGHLILIQRPMRFDRIGCYVATAGGAGAEARLGIYNVNPNTLYPSSLILDAGTVNCTTTGHKELVIDLTLARGWYFPALNCNDGTIQIRYRAYGICVLGDSTDSDIPSNQGWGRNVAYGALPNPYPAGGYKQTYRLTALRLAELL